MHEKVYTHRLPQQTRRLNVNIDDLSLDKGNGVFV